MNDSFQYIAPDEEGFKADMLDDLLAAGYYRMQHMMFTCNDTAMDDDGRVIPVFWLRTMVRECRLQKSAKSILKKCAGFSIGIVPAYVDNEIESLYALYKEHVPFSVSRTCASYLHQEALPNPFNSLMVQVRDRDLLIAAGYFDDGHQAIAGIMNIYHPEYKMYSLGKLLMLQKLQFARLNNKTFYYTGYISTKSTRFDYKTFPDPAAVEVLLPVGKEWLPYQLFGKTFLAEYYQNFLL